MTEAERSQEDAQRRGGHDPVTEHPARRASAWLMWLAPTTIVCTNVRTYRRGRSAPTGQARRTVTSTKGRFPAS